MGFHVNSFSFRRRSEPYRAGSAPATAAISFRHFTALWLSLRPA